MTDIKKNIPLNAEEMECLILKYMKKHNVKRREAKIIVCANGFHKNTLKRLDEVRTPPNNSLGKKR